MESIQPEVLRSAIKEVWIRALTEVQPDVLNALVKARAEETNPRGQQYLDILIENAKKAKAPSRTHAKKKAADAAIVPPTAEKPQPGAVC